MLKLQYFGHLMLKDPDAEKDWGQEKGMTEDEMVGWLSQQALGDGEGPGAWYAAVHAVAKSQTWLSNWITILFKETQRFQESRSNATCPGPHKSRFKI